MNQEKECAECGSIKELKMFYDRKTTEDLHDPICKSCRSSAYYIKNRDKMLAKAKKYAVNNRERIREYKKDYSAKNKDKINKYHRDNYPKNKEQHNVHVKNWKIKNRGKVYAISKRYTEKHPEKTKAHRAVRSAIQRGDMTRMLCEECKATEKIEAHHWSYKEEHWLDVNWLCVKHHTLEHARIRAVA